MILNLAQGADELYRTDPICGSGVHIESHESFWSSAVEYVIALDTIMSLNEWRHELSAVIRTY